MKIFLSLLLLLPGAAVASLDDSPATAKNSVPLAMEIHYFSPAGKELRLYRREGFVVMRDGVCRTGMITGYEVDYSFDDNAKAAEIEVSDNDWVIFRESLRDVHLEQMKPQSDELMEVKSWTWSVRITFPDAKVAIQESDSPGLEARFDKLKKAIATLIEKSRPNKPPQTTTGSATPGRV